MNPFYIDSHGKFLWFSNFFGSRTAFRNKLNWKTKVPLYFHNSDWILFMHAHECLSQISRGIPYKHTSRYAHPWILLAEFFGHQSVFTSAYVYNSWHLVGPQVPVLLYHLTEWDHHIFGPRILWRHGDLASLKCKDSSAVLDFGIRCQNKLDAKKCLVLVSKDIGSKCWNQKFLKSACVHPALIVAWFLLCEWFCFIISPLLTGWGMHTPLVEAGWSGQVAGVLS